MPSVVIFKLLAIFAIVVVGWIVGKLKWLGPGGSAADPARTLANAAYFIFVPALLFRTTARIEFKTMPWGTLVAIFVPMVAMLLVVYAWQRRGVTRGALPPAGPSVRAITAVFGNSVQVGIPMAAALFGEAGLGIHIALVSLHALVLLTVLTVLVELDLARARAQHGATAGLLRTLRQTVRNTLIHPVVLPVLAGLVWQATGWPLPAVLDETLQLLGTAVAPLCLVLIGITLAYTAGKTVAVAARAALGLSLLKLLGLPALVLAAAHWGFGLSGLPLQVVVLMAALPCGSNALIFAQRYRSQEAETTTAIVLSTLGFVFTAPLWLALLVWLG